MENAWCVLLLGKSSIFRSPRGSHRGRLMCSLVGGRHFWTIFPEIIVDLPENCDPTIYLKDSIILGLSSGSITALDIETSGRGGKNGSNASSSGVQLQRHISIPVKKYWGRIVHLDSSGYSNDSWRWWSPVENRIKRRIYEDKPIWARCTIHEH